MFGYAYLNATRTALSRDDLSNSADSTEKSLGMRLITGSEQTAEKIPRTIDKTKLIAFYLPQYHRIPENDDWWGPGFTEWTNVARGRPNFDGHYQPHIPSELGFYDLSYPDVIRRQAEMARLYGISGFCFYHYWFSGRRLLERPLDLFLRSDIDISFCICWANENWTRTWDGDTKSVLLEQKHSLGEDAHFFQSIVDVLRDRRYIKIDGKPILIVYRAKSIANPQQTFATWRRMAVEAGLGGLHISVVDFYDISNPAEVDADSLIEFPPHKFNGTANAPNPDPPITNPSFSGSILDYRKVIAQSLQKVAPQFTYFRGIVPNWDNTARRQDTPTTVIYSTPEWYGKWLAYLRAYTRRHAKRPDEALIFVNAWNEWGEGCHLEPDVKWGLQFLESTFKTCFLDPATSLEKTAAALHTDLLHALDEQPEASRIRAALGRAGNGVVVAKTDQRNA
jgi:lipopolysaccharide biosynthesis protein